MKKNKNWPVRFACLFTVALFCLLFGRFMFGSSVLMATDPVISAANKNVSEVLAETVANWNSGVLLGVPQGSSTQIANLLQAVLPGILWNNVIYGLACLMASLVFLAGFGRRLGPWAALCGALAAFWVGSNFTLLYAGHGLKPYVVLFFVCSVLSAGIPSWRGGIIWGGFTGLMFAQQPDVAMFFSLFAGAHLIFSLWRRDGFKPQKWVRVLVPAAIVAFLFAGGPLLSGYKLNVKDAAQVQTETPGEKWDYITQWSFPPEESIALIAPGYTGWRSGEPDGPYWGRMGRSAGWGTTHKGFMNFMLESRYIGFIPVAFALFAVFSCRRSKHRAEILFWGGAALVALLLSFGKFFPLYSLFYKLPVVNNIRNPNKFLQIFQVALAILTAYGISALFGQKPEDEKRESELKNFFWITVGALGILGFWALGLSMNRTEGIAEFTSQGWPAEAAKTIVKNQAGALWHAVFMSAVVTAVFALFSFPRFGKLLRFRNWIAGGLVLLLSADAMILSKHYIKAMPRSYIEANALTDFLKKDLGTGRVALLDQQGVAGLWAAYLFPYNKIPTFNFSDMPRMASDYETFLKIGQRDPLSMWRFSSVKYLLAPVAAEKQLLAAGCRRVFSFNVSPAPDRGYRIAPDMKGPYAVFELSGTLPHYALFAGSRKGSDEEALRRLSDFTTVILPPDSPLPELSGSGQTGTVDVLDDRSERVDLRVKSDVPAILRCSEKYDPDWRASIDGKPVAVGRVDYLCQGVAVPAGEHRIELRYAPSKLFFYMQCAGALILAGASLWAFIRRGKGDHGAD